MGGWSFWSGCAESCRPSVRARARHIELQPSNSGKPCPSLQQRSGCMEYRDRQGKHCGHNTGVHIHQHIWFYHVCNCSFRIRIYFPTVCAAMNELNGIADFSYQALHSSPAWSLARGGPSMTAMETPWTLGRFHIMLP